MIVFFLVMVEFSLFTFMVVEMCISAVEEKY